MDINILYSKIEIYLFEKDLELEARFINIDKKKFYKLLDFLKSKKFDSIQINTSDLFIKENNQNIRYSCNSDECINKNKLFEYPLLDYNFEIFLCKELKVNKKVTDFYDPFLIRIKDRYRFFLYNKTIAVDLTIVNSSNLISYEVEVEILSKIDLNSLQFLKNTLFSSDFGILKILLDTSIVYTNKLLKNVLTDFNQLLQNNITYTYISSITKLNGMTIFPTPFGIKKYIFLHKTGIWLLFSNTEANLISTDYNPLFDNIIIDGYYINNSSFVPLTPITSNLINFLNNYIKLYTIYSSILPKINSKNIPYKTIGYTITDNNIFYKYNHYTLDLKFNYNIIQDLPTFSVYNNNNNYVVFSGTPNLPFSYLVNTLPNDFNSINEDSIIEVYSEKINDIVYLKFLRYRNDKNLPNSLNLAINIWNIINS